MQDQMEWSYGGTDHYDYVKNPDIQKNNYHSFHQDQYPPDNQIASPCLEIPTEGGLESVDFQFSDNHNRNKKLNFKGYAETNNANTTYEVLDQHKQQWQQLEGVNYQRSPDLQEEIQISREEMQKQRNKIASANYLERLNERMEASERDALVIILSNDHMQFKNQQKLKFMQLAVDSLFLILDDNNQNEIDFDVNAIRQLVHNFEQEKLLIEKTVENNRKEDIDMADKLKEWKKAEEKLKDDEYNLKNMKEMMPILGIKEGTFGSRCTRSRQNVRTAFCEYQIRFESHEQDKQRRLSKLLDYHLDFLRPHVRPILSNWLMNSHHPVETWSAEEIGAYHYFLYRDAG